MLTVLRISNMVKSLDEGDGVTVEVSTHDGKCSYAHDLGKDETTDLVEALDTWGRDCSCCDTLREQVTRLTNTNTELSAAVAQMTEAAEETFSYRDLKDRLADAVSERNRLKQRVAEMTSGKPAAWLVRGQYGYCYRDTEEQARATYQDATLIPLFLANGGPEAAELAAKVEATGKELADARADLDDAAELQRQAENRAFSLEKLLSAEKRMREETRLDLVKAQEERDAWQLSQGTVAREKEALKARVETLLSGEYLAANALAAAEKRAEKAEFDRDNAVSGRTSAQHLLKHAEARVKVLEGDAVPALWAVIQPSGHVGPCYKTKERAETVAPHFGTTTVEPLYRHPPKPAGEPVAWRWIGFGSPTVGLRRPGDNWTGVTDIAPLYEAPPPAAIGVTDERCVVLEVDRLRTVNVKGPDHLIGSRAQAEERAKALHGTAYRLVQIDAPVVDIAAIRKALATLRGVRIWTGGDLETGAAAFTAIEAAIGEKA